MIEDIAPYAIAFASTLAATLALTPLVRSAALMRASSTSLEKGLAM